MPRCWESYSNGKVVKVRCSKARAGLVGEKKAGPVMDVPGRAQAWARDRKRLPAQGNPGGASKAQTGAVEALERGQVQEPQIRTEDERCYIHRR